MGITHIMRLQVALKLSHYRGAKRLDKNGSHK